ncbi:MAG: helix-turn-helix domain-containing protein [Salinivirgaceae bacterium]
MSNPVIIIDELRFDKLLRKIDTLTEDVKLLASKKDNGLKEKWLITDEVCTILDISKRRLQQMRTNGEVEFTKVGKKVYYKSSNIEKLLEAASE